MTRQKALEYLIPPVASVVVGAGSGYQHFDMLTGVIPGACAIGLIALWVNWDSVQFDIKAEQWGRPFWPTVILAIQAFIFLSIVSFVIQVPAFLLAGWLHH